MEKISKFAYRLRIKCKILLYNVGGVGKKDMKDFCKWLGVNEKVAKLIVWLFIGMSMLIIFNVALESMGLPFYKITVDNLAKLSYNKIFDYLLNWIIILLNFYSMVLMVFRVREFKNILPYSILYLVLNIFVTETTNGIIANAFVPLFICIFCYFYSNKNWKYVLYGIASLVINTFIQYICYLYKIRFIDFNNISYLNKFLSSIDFFIIMFILIFIKEKILKKRKEVT